VFAAGALSTLVISKRTPFAIRFRASSLIERNTDEISSGDVVVKSHAKVRFSLGHPINSNAVKMDAKRGLAASMAGLFVGVPRTSASKPSLLVTGMPFSSRIFLKATMCRVESRNLEAGQARRTFSYGVGPSLDSSSSTQCSREVLASTSRSIEVLVVASEDEEMSHSLGRALLMVKSMPGM
jgi:hypothetical protein